jgi:uncharacterized membrane protein
MAIATLFIQHGAWHILFYSMLEACALACAFVYHARHIADHEHLELADGCLLVERVQGGAVQRLQLDSRWTRVVSPRRAHELIYLEAKGMKIEVGRFISDVKRQEVARELRRELTAEAGFFCAAQTPN